MHRKLSWARGILTASLFSVGSLLLPAQAATIVVNTLEDETSVDGDCSLREAIQASNVNGPIDGCVAGDPGVEAVDIITFDPALAGQTIFLTQFGSDFENDNLAGDLDIFDGNLIIAGPGNDATSITIDGMGNQVPPDFAPHRILHVIPQTTFFTRLELRNLTLRNGAVERTAPANGGAIAIEPVDPTVGCTPLPVGNPFPCLRLLNVVIEDNVVTSFQDAAFGGGVAVNMPLPDGEPGAIVIENSRFDRNIVNSVGAEADGGGVLLRLTTLNFQAPTLYSVDIQNSQFNGNRLLGVSGASSSGGGLQLVSNNISSVSLTDTGFLDNQNEGDFTVQGAGASMTLSGNSDYPITISGGTFLRNNSRGTAADIVRGAGLNLSVVGLSELTIENSRFEQNSATSLGNGRINGGALAMRMFSANGYPLNISSSDFLNNSASGAQSVLGGGIYLLADDLLNSTIENTRISGNFAQYDQNIDGGIVEGAGLFADISFSSVAPQPLLNILNSEISENDINHQGVDGNVRPAAAGAGLNVSVFNPALEATGCPLSVPCVDIRNSTISGNSILIPQGDAEGAGAILGRDVQANFNNITLVENSSQGGVALNGGLSFSQNMLVDMSNSIIALNLANGTPRDCSQAAGSALNSLGYNFIGNNNGCIASPQMGDQLGVEAPIDPLLDALAFFGESQTRSHQPMLGSPVVDAGDPNGSCETVDQNGVGRPQDGDADGTPLCDIGAVELVADAPPSIDNPIPDQTLQLGGPTFSIDLNTVFSDPEGGPLSFNAISNNTDVVFAATEGSSLLVQAIGAGTTTVLVTAIDESLQETSLLVQFTVSAVQGNQPPSIIASIPDQNLPEQGGSVDINLDQIFEDPEGDTLLFEAVSSNPDVVDVLVSGSILQLIPGSAGVATVTVTAFDAQGQAANIRLKSRAGLGAAASGAGSGSGGASLGSGSSGGCAMTAGGQPDPLFWLMTLAALAGLRRAGQRA